MLAAACLAALPTWAQQPPPFTPQPILKTAPPVLMTQEPDYSDEAVRNGLSATQEQCARIDAAVWGSAPDGQGACLRYWAEGFTTSAPVPRAIVYFPGDVWDARGVIPGYRQNAQRLPAIVKDYSATVGMPYVLMARPGTYGASGDHMQRRRAAESLIISSALDALKARHGIREFVVVGYSGGGHVVASLLIHRSDIVCAVPTAGVASPKLRAQLQNWSRDSTGHEDSFEPLEHLAAARMHPQLRVFVLGDPQDRNGVWPAQTILADKLAALKVPAKVIEAQGTGPQRHGGLGQLAHQVGSWCAAGLPDEAIVQRAKQLP